MLPNSAKAKARRLQNYVAEKILEYFPDFTENDIWPALMGQAGEDIKMSQKAFDKIPFSFEAKNRERLNLWGSLKQASDNCKGRIPVVVFKRNRSKTYAIIEFEHFMELWHGNCKD